MQVMVRVKPIEEGSQTGTFAAAYFALPLAWQTMLDDCYDMHP